MDIIKANEVLQYLYRPPLKGIFDNKEVDELVGEACKRMLLKEVTKAQFATVVATEVSVQVEDIIDEEEEEPNKQYAAIEIDYKAEVIGGV